MDYNRIAKVIQYINQNFKEQPSLDEIAKAIHLSPFHFQRLFTEWAGVSPKKFLQFISLSYAKQSIKVKVNTLFDVMNQTGLSSSSRLHALFICMEGMTPAEYRNGGENLTINYQFAISPFGNVIIASTNKGICHLAFFEDSKEAFEQLLKRFPSANYNEKAVEVHLAALAIFNQDMATRKQVRLHLSGTPFQLKVWEALLKIQLGGLSTYGQVANEIGSPKASRAVGTAIGSNPIAFLIPCHRVIQATGKIGGYMWDPIRKTAIIGWEAAKTDSIENVK